MGWLKGMDGRVLQVKSEHGSVNDLLQGDGAVLMKWALHRLVWEREQAGWRLWDRWALLLNVHDEWQAEALPEDAEELGQAMVESIRWVGRYFRLRVELDGSYHVGASWKETH